MNTDENMRWRTTMFRACLILFATFLVSASVAVADAPPLGLPPVPVPENNPITPEKVDLGNKLFHDIRFSATGEVACANCHVSTKAFTDSPLQVSEGIKGLTGTRNAPTIINAAYLQSQFWDGREPSLESQSAQPFLNPVEMGLQDHQPILDIVRSDPDYVDAFKAVFGKTGDQVTMTEVKMAIATFERTIIAGDSPFDRYRYGGDTSAMSESAIRGLEVYLNDGRCVSCHSIEENHALFSDSRFHNLGVGFERIAADVDIEVLTNKNTSELGRFAVTDEWRDMGGFKTPTLRNIDKTAPYMHDGSLKTLEEVVDFYNNGGRVKETDPTYPFQSGGIRPLDLSDQQKKDLVAFMKVLTSPQFAN